jgi:hypothetical protein
VYGRTETPPTAPTFICLGSHIDSTDMDQVASVLLCIQSFLHVCPIPLPSPQAVDQNEQVVGVLHLLSRNCDVISAAASAFFVLNRQSGTLCSCTVLIGGFSRHVTDASSYSCNCHDRSTSEARMARPARPVSYYLVARSHTHFAIPDLFVDRQACPVLFSTKSQQLLSLIKPACTV